MTNESGRMALVGMLLLLCTFAGCSLWSSGTLSGGGVIGSGPVSVNPPTADEVRGALLSIYYVAYEDPSPSPSPGVQPLPLDQALRILSRDESPQGDTRRRRAIATVTGAFAQSTSQGIEWQSNLVDLRLTLTQLFGEPLIRGIEKRIECSQAVDRISKETVAYTAMDFAADPGPEATPAPTKRRCCSCTRFFDVDGPGLTPGKGFFIIWANRDFADVKTVMDPQSWSQCNPDSFASSYVVASNQCLEGDETSPHSTPPPPGSAWEGVLFEQFSWTGAKLCDQTILELQNLLRIKSFDGTTTPSAGSVPFHEIDFTLCSTLSSQIPCGGELTKDCGFAQAKPDYVGTMMTGVKYLDFAGESGIEKWMDAGLRAMIDEIRDEGICCGYSGPIGSCSCANTVQVDVSPPCPM